MKKVKAKKVNKPERDVVLCIRIPAKEIDDFKKAKYKEYREELFALTSLYRIASKHVDTFSFSFTKCRAAYSNALDRLEKECLKVTGKSVWELKDNY